MRPFRSVLVANRGEIACRVLSAAKALGLRGLGVYSDADRGAPHVALADEARRIGPAPASESYLNVQAILEAARALGAEAIHPGYGFLSENAAFARAVEQAGLIFVGPPPRAIEAMGDKAAAKRAMIEARVHCIPGYEGEDQSDVCLATEARRIGYPLMIKAAAGGGGRGMRQVDRAEDFDASLTRARAEALQAFGADQVILERALTQARHVEIQIFADAHGHVVSLGERDCSVQRRHQKVIEEAPSPALDAELRAAMGEAAVKAARAVDYLGAGTVEFLFDEDRRFYFLEMNTRLQVEHPVTEAVTGLDLVELQFRVAMGEPLPFAQGDIRPQGHAIEARLYSEDASANFLPSTGRLALWRAPSGEAVRVDAGVVTGQDVTSYYDPLIAKVIARGATREIARRRLIAALERSVAFGVTTNVEFLIDALDQPRFTDGAATTGFLSEVYPHGFDAPPPTSEEIAIAAALCLQLAYRRALAASPLADEQLRGFQSSTPVASRLDVDIDGVAHRVSALPTNHGWIVESQGEWKRDVTLAIDGDNDAVAVVEGRRRATVFQSEGAACLYLAIGARRLRLTPSRPWEQRAKTASSGAVTAPMPGVVVSLAVEPGMSVRAGEAIAVLEAMKMQHTITAPIDGVVREVFVAVGRQVALRTPIARIEEPTL